MKLAPKVKEKVKELEMLKNKYEEGAELQAEWMIEELKKLALEHDEIESHLEDEYPYNPDCNCSFTRILDSFKEEEKK